MYSGMYQANQTLMENREIISIGILFVLSGIVTFFYLIKNSPMFPCIPSLRPEDENELEIEVDELMRLFRKTNTKPSRNFY
jgi:hypothetical protein